jgi:hypothetical protein
LLHELARPADRMVDAVAKVLEAYGAAYGALADHVEDIAKAVPEITKVIKARRDKAGAYTLGDFETLMKGGASSRSPRGRASAATADSNTEDVSTN